MEYFSSRQSKNIVKDCKNLDRVFEKAHEMIRSMACLVNVK